MTLDKGVIMQEENSRIINEQKCEEAECWHFKAQEYIYCICCIHGRCRTILKEERAVEGINDESTDSLLHYEDSPQITRELAIQSKIADRLEVIADVLERMVILQEANEEREKYMRC